MSLISNIKAEAKGRKPMPELHKDADGAWFDQQPPGTHTAALNDFLDHNGQYRYNMPYLIASEQTPGRFWAFRTRPGFEQRNDFDLFLERGRVYVFENSLIS